jgi:hypothetical protein
MSHEGKILLPYRSPFPRQETIQSCWLSSIERPLIGSVLIIA